MNLSQNDLENIKNKSKRLENIKPILKSEFIGIDTVIDDLIDQISPYYIFPDSISRPLVVNLWGMTGTGKTTLIQRIVELLEYQDRLIKIDVGDYATNFSDWKLKNDLQKKYDQNQKSDMIIVFDEFQFGRTLNEEGKEQDRSSLRPMWEIIDSGVLYVEEYSNFNRNSSASVTYLLEKLLKDRKVEVDNDGIVKEEYVSQFCNILHTKFTMRLGDFKNVDYSKIYDYLDDFSYYNSADAGSKEEKKINKWSKDNGESVYSYEPETEQEKIDHLKKYTSPKDRLYNISEAIEVGAVSEPYFIPCSLYYDYKEKNEYDWDFNIPDSTLIEKFREIGEMTLEEKLRSIFLDTSINSVSMKKIDFSKSLVLCVGNIDEAYAMSGSNNPDADADLFFKHSLSITVPMMKNALRSRFRMEQIGRLGNNHIIYPSISKESYKRIISLNFNRRKERLLKDFGIEFDFATSMEEIMYKESVFPTQGARPIMSSFNSLIDSYITHIIMDCIKNIPDVNKISWHFEELDQSEERIHGRYDIKASNGESEERFSYDVKLNVESNRRSKRTERQCLNGVRLSGECVAVMAVTGLVPDEIVSVSAGNADGFIKLNMSDTFTLKMYMDKICYLYGSMIAEKMIFGDDNVSMKSAASISQATSMAASLVKNYGYTDKKYRISMQSEVDNDGYKIIDSDHQKAITDIISNQEIKCKSHLNKHKSLLLELAKHLSNYSKIDKKMILELVKKHSPDMRLKDDANEYISFRKLLAEKAQ